MLESTDDGQELLVVDRIALFGGGESLGMVSSRAEDQLALLVRHRFVCLVQDGSRSILGGIDFQDELSILVWWYEDGFGCDDVAEGDEGGGACESPVKGCGFL